MGSASKERNAAGANAAAVECDRIYELKHEAFPIETERMTGYPTDCDSIDAV
jgi:hypothetical protein